jgi:hypothetical protein
MKTKVMRNLIIVCIILFVLLSNISFALAQSKQDTKNQGLINLQFVMFIHWQGNDTNEPIHPGELRIVHINITYLETQGFFGGILLRLLQGKTFPMRLSIVDKPEWCTAQIIPENFTGIIEPEKQNVNTFLSIRLNDDAPLNHTLGQIKFTGVIDDMKGPFNILTLVHGYENTCTIAFVTSP